MLKLEIEKSIKSLEDESSRYKTWIETEYEKLKTAALKDDKFEAIEKLDEKLKLCRKLYDDRKKQLMALKSEIDIIKDNNSSHLPSIEDQALIFSSSSGSTTIRKKESGTKKDPYNYSLEEIKLHLENKVKL